MIKDKQISVIITIYNRKEYLNRCFFSVIEQKDVSFEIILVDDGSSDGSEKMIDEYALTYQQVVAIHKENGGLSSARNAGIDICKGEYIFFLDSDDYIEKDSLYKLYKAIKEQDADITIGNYVRHYEDGTLEYENHIPAPYRNRVLNTYDLLSLMYIENSYLWCVAWGKLYKREVFDNIRFPIGKNSEDEYIMPQILEKISKVYLLDDVLYHQVLSKDSIVRSPLSIKKLDATQAILVMINYLMDKGLYDFALFRFGVGTRLLMKWKRETDDAELLDAIKKQYCEYRKIARHLIPHVSHSVKLRLELFCMNFKVYSHVRNIIR